MKPRAFKTQGELRMWLERNHKSETELIVRCYKVHAKDRGIGYKEGLDQALCFGWIDGVRRSIDDDSFSVRLTPRKPKSNWSRVNIKRATELEAEGQMHAAGLEAFRARDKISSAPYSFENRDVKLDAAFEKKFRANKRAWEFYQSMPPWYRRTSAFYVMSAKREETRVKRLDLLIDRCARGEPLPQLIRPK